MLQYLARRLVNPSVFGNRGISWLPRWLNYRCNKANQQYLFLSKHLVLTKMARLRCLGPDIVLNYSYSGIQAEEVKGG